MRKCQIEIRGAMKVEEWESTAGLSHTLLHVYIHDTEYNY